MKSSACRCEDNGRKCNSKQNWNSAYAKSIIDDLKVLCDEILDTPKLALISSTDKTSYLLLPVVLLGVVCWVLAVVITAKYYMKLGLINPWLLSHKHNDSESFKEMFFFQGENKKNFTSNKTETHYSIKNVPWQFLKKEKCKAEITIEFKFLDFLESNSD